MRISDQLDSEWINSIKWSFSKNPGYERISITLSMHDMVINADVRQKALDLIKAVKIHRSNGLIDHINQNKTDNRRENLRYVTNRQNQLNSRTITHIKGVPVHSRYRGVTFDKKMSNSKPWIAAVTNHKRRITYKSFRTEKEAALFWNQEIQKNYPGEIINLNKIIGGEK